MKFREYTISYKLLLRGLVCVVFAGQFLLSSAVSQVSMEEGKFELVEFVDAECAEMEEVKQNEEDSEFRVSDMYGVRVDAGRVHKKIRHIELFAPIHQPESITPPPERV